MNTRELRIGNFVKVGECIVKVNSLTQHKIGYCPESCRERYARSREVEPIRLNEEILAHVSFDNREFKDCIVVVQHEETYKESGLIEIMVSCISPRIMKYLHELQNVYQWFTGSELTMLSE